MKQLILNITKEIHKLDEKSMFIMHHGLQFACGLLLWAVALYFFSDSGTNYVVMDLGRALTENSVLIAAESIIFGFVADILIKKYK